MKIEFEPAMYACLITPLYVAIGRLDGYIHYLNGHKISPNDKFHIYKQFNNRYNYSIITEGLLDSQNPLLGSTCYEAINIFLQK